MCVTESAAARRPNEKLQELYPSQEARGRGPHLWARSAADEDNWTREELGVEFQSGYSTRPGPGARQFQFHYQVPCVVPQVRLMGAGVGAAAGWGAARRGGGTCQSSTESCTHPCANERAGGAHLEPQTKALLGPAYPLPSPHTWSSGRKVPTPH